MDRTAETNPGQNTPMSALVEGGDLAFEYLPSITADAVWTLNQLARANRFQPVASPSVIEAEIVNRLVFGV